jgi:hypothetical protein
LNVVATETLSNRVDRHPGQTLLLGQRDPQLLESLEELGIDLVQAGRPVARALGGGVVDDLLEVDGRMRDVRPPGLAGLARERRPVPVGPKPPLQHELGLALLGRDQADDVLAEPGRQRVGLDVADEAPPVLPVGQGLECLDRCTHGAASPAQGIPWPIYDQIDRRWLLSPMSF